MWSLAINIQTKDASLIFTDLQGEGCIENKICCESAVVKKGVGEDQRSGLWLLDRFSHPFRKMTIAIYH